MHLILPGDHHALTCHDVDYLTDCLEVNGSQQAQFRALLSDPDALDVMLDSDQLYRRLIGGQEPAVSTQLFFFVLIRRALMEVGLDEREVADYLANLLTAYANAPLSQPPTTPEALETGYLADLLRASAKGSRESRFFIRSHIANYALYITGIFPERLRYRSPRQSTPDFAYFEELAQGNYQACAEDPLALQFGLDQVYAVLSQRFHAVRVALNRVAELQLYHGQPHVNHSAILADVVKP